MAAITIATQKNINKTTTIISSFAADDLRAACIIENR
jgi:hypothetical protein